VVSRIRLARGVPRADFEVTVDNAARDHRFQVHFPTGIITQEAFYDGHFAVSRRALAMPGGEETADWAEQPAVEQPQRAFTTVLGDENGLTVAARGLPESAVLAGPDGVTIVLTLLRCVGWLSRDDLPNRQQADGPPVATPEAQCLGEHTFQYSLIPHGADPLPAWQHAWNLQTSLTTLVTDIHGGQLGACASLAEVDNPAFVLSAVKQSTDGKGMIVRGYNVSVEPQQVILRTDAGFSTASYARLDETPFGKRMKADELGLFRFEAGPGQIVTLRLSK
jgi:mannosylglycerate hydrolase